MVNNYSVRRGILGGIPNPQERYALAGIPSSNERHVLNEDNESKIVIYKTSNNPQELREKLRRLLDNMESGDIKLIHVPAILDKGDSSLPWERSNPARLEGI